VIEILFTLTAFELFVGGGGRVLEVGPVTVRMLLYAICIVSFIYLAASYRLRGTAIPIAVVLVVLFLLTHLPSFLVGHVRGASSEDIFADASPLLYWLIAPFFALVLQREHMVMRTATLVQVAAVFMASAYLVVLAAFLFEQIVFEDFYQRFGDSTELFFRVGGLFFYKGFLYLGIGAIFLIALRGQWWKFWLALVVAALILSLTRGFILATAIAATLMLWTMKQRVATFVVVALAALSVFIVFVYIPSQDETNLLDQRDESNSVRVGDISFFVDNVGVGTLLIGEGFGSYLNGRLNVEISYLAILWKFGLVSLTFWLLPLGLAFYYFRQVPPGTRQFRVACAFAFGTVLVYVQTATNPYLNNPIGLSFVMMAVFSLRTLAVPRVNTLSTSRRFRPEPKSSHEVKPKLLDLKG